MSLAPGSHPVVHHPGGYRFPPGPRHDLLWQVLKTFHPVRPIQFFQHLQAEYGNIAHYRVAGRDVIFINDPAYIQQVLVFQNDRFIKERTVQRSKLLLGEGMITSEGSAWRAQRGAAQPAFHRQQISAYASTMVDLANAASNRWQHGSNLDLSLEMMNLTLSIVAKVLFDTNLEDEGPELVTAINSIMKLYNFMVIVPAAERLVSLPLPGILAFRRARQRVDKTVYRMIEEHRRGLRSKEDLLSMMIESHCPGQSESLLRDEVITILLAGYETVSNALTWTWYLLSEHPHVDARLQAELHEVLDGQLPTSDDYPRLRYAEMVLGESMRLFPPAWGMGRLAVSDFELPPYRFPAGTIFFIK